MLNFLGDAGGFRDALFTKIDARTPFFFEVTRMWEQFKADRMNGEDRFISVRMLLDRLMIYPTGTKIFNQDKLDEIRDDYLVKFNPRNVNPGIYTPFDSGSVWIDSPNLHEFGEGNHALLTSESDHYVDSSDCSVYTPDFRRQSPFVIRDTDKHFGFVSSGIFFTTDFGIEKQKIPVSKANWAAATRLVGALEAARLQRP